VAQTGKEMITKAAAISFGFMKRPLVMRLSEHLWHTKRGRLGTRLTPLPAAWTVEETDACFILKDRADLAQLVR